ncbi:serine-rich adhesin for platelets isoform X2 [Palaemon carinicauda]
MPSSSREKSPRVSKVFAKISSDSKLQRNQDEEQKEESKDGSSASPVKSHDGKDVAESVKPKKTRRSILPYFRGHKNGKKGEKEKEKLKKEKAGDKDAAGKDVLSSASPNKETDAQLPQVAETPEAEAAELVTKEADALSPKEFSESECASTSDVTEVTDCISQISTDFSERALETFKEIPENEDVDFTPYSALHSSQTPIYETPIRMPQNYQKSFLHNRYGSNSSVETLPGRFDRIPSGSSSISSISSFSTLAALRSRTLEPVSRRTQEPLAAQMPITYTRCSTLDSARARFQNNVTNLTYEGIDFSSVPKNPTTSSTWSLNSKTFTSPFSKFSLNSTESSKASSKEKDKKSKGTAESKVTAKSGVKKILLNNRLKEETISETSPERKPLLTELPIENKLKVESVNNNNKDSITIIANKNVRAKLNITVVKTPELARKNLGSFRFARTGIRSSVRSSQKKRKTARSPPSTSPPPSLTPTSPTLVRLKPVLKTIDGKIIPEYAKVNKRKHSKPDIVDDDSGEKVLTVPSHSHESPAEKAPIVKKIEAAAHKGRKDLEPSLKVNPVKRAESFKGPSRVCRRSSFTYASRAKVFKEGLDPDSFVKSQAIKLRRKDSKNGRLDMKNARKAEYRLSVTIKPSTVATLTNKFNTMISQNQAGNPLGKAELPVSHVSLQEARVTRSPKPNVRFKNRTKMGRNYSGSKEKFKEGACLMDEKSIKEEKNREEKRGDLSVPAARKTNPRTSRSPSPKKTVGKNGSILLEKLGDNKTDEEKVCEKIKTALSSAKFKGETDDSEDDVVDQETNDETKYKVRVPSTSTSPANGNDNEGDTSQPSSAAPAVPEAGVSSSSSMSPASESTIPKIMKPPGQTPSSNLRDILAKISERNVNHYTEIDEVYPLPERHAKSDSMDSGISTEGEILSGAGSISIGNTTLIISSVPSFPVCSQDQEDSSLDTVKSTETAKSEDSGVAFQDIVASEDIMNQAEETILDSIDEVSVVSSEEKGIIDVLETEGKDVDNIVDGAESEENSLKDSGAASQPEVQSGSKSTGDILGCTSHGNGAENIVTEEDLDDKIIEPDTRSITSSCMDDTHSEVSSVCSEAKSKKSGKVNESRIYSAVKAAVKNTVKKTKEKDAERKEEKDKEKRNRSPSADREKWYRRGRSKERRQDKKKEEKDQEVTEEQEICEDDANKGDEKAESPKKEAKEREGRTYERFTFKKLREKSQERRRFKEKSREEEEKRKEEEKKNSDDTKKDTKNKKKEEKSKEDSTYGKFTIGSRSRSRDRKKIKEKFSDQLSIEPIDIKDSQEVSPSPKTADSLKQQESPASAASVKENSTCTLPFLNRNKNENLVFTFDTESLYDKPLTPKINMKSKTLPPPPKTPIPSPPSSATPLPPPPNTPIPDPPIESEKDRDSLEASLMSKDSDDHCNGDSDSSNETENIYENLYSPNMEKLHRNREKLEGRGIKPNNSFLWSDGVPPTPAVTETSKTEPISEESECERSPFTRLIGVKTYGKTNRYGKISPSNKSRDGADGHNYAELQPTSEDTQTIAYDDIGAVSAVSYDDISAPSSCGYDDIGTSSSTGYDTIKPPSEGYDPVNPPRSDSSQYDDCDGGIVTAQLAVVREDQLDSISYMYDEISMYNASQNSHSYEPVYPPGVSPQGRPGVSSIEEVPETDSSTPAATPTVSTLQNTKEARDDCNNESSDGSEDESEDGVHEVFSYKLTRIGGGLEAMSPTAPTTPSTPGSTLHSRIYGSVVPPPLGFCQGVGCEGNLSSGGGDRAPSPSLSPTEGKSETSDEWMDVSDTETDTSTGPPISIVTQIPLVRMRQRSKRYRHHRNWRRSWSQGVRDVAAHMQTHSHHQSHAHTLGHYHDHHHHRYHHHHYHHHHAHGSSSSSSAARGEAAREYSWRDGGDSDDEDNATGHYEAIYEVINPAEDGHQCDEQDSDDSFESDDSNDAYTRLRPQFHDDGSQTSRDHAESLSSEVSTSEKLQLQLQSPLQQQQQQQEQQQQNQQQQQRSITKIAEAANLGMRRLRRNWSQTKDEVKTGLSRIKKKSTFSVSDMKSTENLACDLTPTLTPTSADNKRKWSFRSHFRRKSMAGSVTTVVSRGGGGGVGPPSKKESATFYLTLTIETERQDAGEMSDASQQTARSDSESVLSSASTQEYRKSNTPSIASMTTVGSSSDTTVPLRQHRPSSIIHHRKSTASCSYAPVRPRTAPPAPPPKEKDNEPTTGDSEVDEHSKTSVALRLNQLLSTGPTAPPGRRVLRTSEGSSSDTSPVPVLVHPDDGGYTTLRVNSVKYATINMNNSRGMAEDSSGDEKALSPEVTSSVMHNVPHTRISVVSSSSHGSSEGYIRPCDIASAPPPLPARRTPVTHQPRFRLPPPSRLSQPMLVQMPSSLPDGDNNSYLDFSCDALNQEEPLYVSSHFADEPLYQFYTAKLLERAAQSQGDCSSEDDYEVINDGQHSIGGKLQTRPTAMELVTPADGRRTLWCELPEVIESGLLSQISTQEKKTQEAMFEMITSEASYLKSLNVLVTHFVQCPEFTVDEGEDAVLSRRERHILFSDILPVKRCSELFLADLEKRWQESVRISKISDIILKHANNHFQVYVKYCSNQIYQDRILKELKENNPKFLEVLNRLESSPVCQSLAMHSFLMLPMQRITRLPLLVDAIFHRLKHDTPDWEECKSALATLTKIVAECNEGARKMERMEEMLILSRQLDFREVKAIPLISASRWLVKKGELTRLTWKENDKLTFGKRISKHTLYFFLFTDLLVVTKKKSDDQYMVLDYCSRNMVQVLELDATDKFPGRILDGHKNLLIMTMLQNHENKTVEMVVSCPMESDRLRWVEAVTPRTSENPDERIYEEWDCPQVQAIHPYVAKESDELSLEVSDVVNVLKKMSDGWYQGERIRDQERGWFPGSFTVEISSSHVRARNLRQRYRLLAISSSLLDELKREKERFDKEEKRKDRRRTLTMKEVISSQAQALN